MSPVRPATGPAGSSRLPCCASPLPGPKYQSCCDWLRGAPVCTTRGPGRDSGSLCPPAIRALATLRALLRPAQEGPPCRKGCHLGRDARGPWRPSTHRALPGCSQLDACVCQGRARGTWAGRFPRELPPAVGETKRKPQRGQGQVGRTSSSPPASWHFQCSSLFSLPGLGPARPRPPRRRGMCPPNPRDFRASRLPWESSCLDSNPEPCTPTSTCAVVRVGPVPWRIHGQSGARGLAPTQCCLDVASRPHLGRMPLAVRGRSVACDLRPRSGTFLPLPMPGAPRSVIEGSPELQNRKRLQIANGSAGC